MALRHNHYDAAFEAFLREERTPHVVVDEARRAVLQNASLKSMDFIVHAPGGAHLLVDVKGRKFPSGGEQNRHLWENWATDDDLVSLARWQEVFGAGFRAVLVFAYHILDDRYADQFETCFEHRDRQYAFYGVWVDEFRESMKTRSASWATVSLPTADFRRLRRPISTFLGCPVSPNAPQEPTLESGGRSGSDARSDAPER